MARRWSVVELWTRTLVAVLESTVITPGAFVSIFRVKATSNIDLVHGSADSPWAALRAHWRNTTERVINGLRWHIVGRIPIVVLIAIITAKLVLWLMIWMILMHVRVMLVKLCIR